MPTHAASKPIVITHEEGLRFAAQVRTHRVILDQPSSAGGQDVGPMPTEMLGVALGSCVALYVRQFCHVRGVSTTDMRVEVEQVSARDPSRVAEFAVRVVLTQPIPLGYGEMLERVVRTCPVHNTFAHSPLVHVTIDAPVVGKRSAPPTEN
jgi:uncharacterized OsmC-like protein